MSELIYNHTFFEKAFKMSSLNEGYYGEFHRDYYDDLDLHCEEIFDEIEKKTKQKNWLAEFYYANYNTKRWG